MANHTNIKDDGLLSIYQDGVLYGTRASNFKEYASPIAKAYDGINPPVPGLMYPGNGFFYDPTTGELEVNLPFTTNFIDVIPSGTTAPKPTPTVGDFYIASINQTLGPEWGSVGGTTVQSGDMIIYNESNDWAVIENSAATSSVVIIHSDTPSLIVEGSVPTEPRLMITEATQTQAGLFSSSDKAKLDNLDGSFINADFTSLPSIP